MGTVELLFTSADEFIEELRLPGRLPKGHVVRLTIQKRQSGGGLPLHHVSLIATTCWPHTEGVWGLCTLRYYFGEDMSGAPGQASGEAAHAMVARLSAKLTDMGFEVRQGVLLPTDRDRRPGTGL